MYLRDVDPGELPKKWAGPWKIDRAMELKDGDVTVLYCGYCILDLLLREIFVWIIPGPGLTAWKMREAMRLWREGIAGWSGVNAAVVAEDSVAKRYARFFGLRPTGDVMKEYELWRLQR